MVTPIGKTLSVGELITELQKYPQDMPVVDDGFNGIEAPSVHTWVDSNYPYDKPDFEVLMII